MRWADIDFERKTLHVCNSMAKVHGGVVDKSPKSDTSDRILPIPDGALCYLAQLQEQQRANARTMGTRYNSKWEGYVCVDNTGNVLLPDYVTHEMAKICAKRSLPKIKLHELRHTHASFLLSVGASMKEAQEALGHADYSTTANTYAHIPDQRKQEIASRVESLITG